MRNIHKSITYNSIQPANVDRENGIIKSVVIVNAGLDKNGDNIDTTFLNQIAEQGNSQTVGVKSRFDHPNMCATTFGYYAGRYKNFSVSGESVIADLYLDPVAKTSPHGNLYDYILNMSESNPDMFGNSIVFAPAKSHVVKEKDESGNETNMEYIRCGSFIASDIVDSPAATNSLFKSELEIPNAIVLTQFLDENPQITELVIKNENLINDFLKKYKSNNQIKIQMAQEKENSGLLAEFKNISKSIFAKLGLNSKSITAKTPAGINVTVVTDASAPMVGDSVNYEDGLPVNDGAYVCDGYEFTTVGGKIDRVTEVEMAADNTAVEAEVKSLKSEVAKLTADYEKSQNDLKSALTDLKAINEHLINVKSTFKVAEREMASSEKEKQKAENEITSNSIKERKKELQKAK